MLHDVTCIDKSCQIQIKQNNLLIVTIAWFDYSKVPYSKLIVGSRIIALCIFIFQDAIGNCEVFTYFYHWLKPE